MGVEEVDLKSWEKEVLKYHLPVVVDFYSSFCPPCSVMEKILESISEKYTGRVKFVRVDVDAEEELAERYYIMSVPTIGIVVGGELIQGFTGVIDENILIRAIESVI